MNIVLLETAQVGLDIPYDCLEDFGNVTAYESTETAEEAADRLADADVVIVNHFPMNEASLYKAKHLKLITMTATGTNFVDFDYVGKRGIKVANIRGYSTHSVSQHTFALLFYLWEKLRYFDDYVKSGGFVDDYANSSFSTHFNELAGKTWGIVGMGNIGEQVAKVAAAFGCNVICFSPSGRTYEGWNQVDFDTLLSQSDIVSVHTPLTPGTRGLFGYEQFSKMKPTAYFINVARGAVVKEEGLARALKEDIIAGAGLDVLAQEPMSPESLFLSIQDSNKLIITPHMAWAAVEARNRAIREIYLNIESFVKGEPRNICTK